MMTAGFDIPSWFDQIHREAELHVGPDEVPVVNDDGYAPANSLSPRPRLRATPFQWVPPETLPPRRWVYGHHLIRGFVSLTIAPGATGKSSLLIADALALVTGRDLLGASVYGGPKRVWVWNLEDPADELQRRIQATMLHAAITPADIGDRLFIDSGRVQGLCLAETRRDGVRILEPVAEALEAELLAREIDVLMVDPFVSSHAVSENDNTAIDMVAKRWGVIADRTGCAIELVHHLRKLGLQEATAESSRGAIALVAAARSVRVLNKMTQEEAEKAGLDHPRGYFRIGHDKENLAPASGGADWFHIASVSLPNGDNVGVVEPWDWPDAFDGITVYDLFKVQTAIDGKGCRLNVQAKDWVGHAVADVLGLDIANKADKARIGSMVRTWIKTGALVVVEVEDEHRKLRPTVVVGKWANS